MNNLKIYDAAFYGKRHGNTLFSAQLILSTLFEVIPKIESAVDIGCGVGTWLSVLKNLGVKEIQGVDGDWVDKRLLVIPEADFTVCDLTRHLELDRKFDLAISLEVVEHIPEHLAGQFIDSLTRSSDLILFSAAVPCQGGINHLNEQWPEYWVDLFRRRNFRVFDFIRGRIWNDARIPVYYRQNIMFFAREERIGEIRVPAREEGCSPLSVVHPETYLTKLNRMSSLPGAWRLFREALRNDFIRKMKLRDKA